MDAAGTPIQTMDSRLGQINAVEKKSRLLHQTSSSNFFIRLLHQTSSSNFFIRLLHQTSSSESLDSQLMCWSSNVLLS
jgi:hypothetical protein